MFHKTTYDKRDDFNFDFHFLMEMFFRSLFVLREYVRMIVTSTTETIFFINSEELLENFNHVNNSKI